MIVLAQNKYELKHEDYAKFYIPRPFHYVLLSVNEFSMHNQESIAVEFRKNIKSYPNYNSFRNLSRNEEILGATSGHQRDDELEISLVRVRLSTLPHVVGGRFTEMQSANHCFSRQLRRSPKIDAAKETVALKYSNCR